MHVSRRASRDSSGIYIAAALVIHVALRAICQSWRSTLFEHQAWVVLHPGMRLTGSRGSASMVD